MTDYFAGLDGNLDEYDTPHAGHDMTGQLTTADDAKRFMLAGKATVTLVSKKTHTRFTFKISAAPSGEDTFFVGLLNGPDNESNYA